MVQLAYQLGGEDRRSERHKGSGGCVRWTRRVSRLQQQVGATVAARPFVQKYDSGPEPDSTPCYQTRPSMCGNIYSHGCGATYHRYLPCSHPSARARVEV